jgi:hypothetical protein
MSGTNEDPVTMPESELLALPGDAIPAGSLSAFFTRKAALLHQHDLDELVLELSGNSARHFMIFADLDPRERRRREEEERRRAGMAGQEQLEYYRRLDHLLAQIDEQQRRIEKRRKEIEDNALRLHDGRRVYVDGDQYDDECGRVLQGRDRDEAAEQHSLRPAASTWEEKQDIDRQAEEMKRLREKVLASRDGEGTTEDKRQKLDGYEQEFAAMIAARQDAMNVARSTGIHGAVPDYGSADYRTELGGEYTISIVPAFTRAAEGLQERTPLERNDTDKESLSTQNKPKPGGQSTFKL